jgi:hypothetical protein
VCLKLFPSTVSYQACHFSLLWHTQKNSLQHKLIRILFSLHVMQANKYEKNIVEHIEGCECEFGCGEEQEEKL